MGGGKFKACFCDPDTLAAGKYCKKAADYKIDIGAIHVSGVSCLVEDPKFQRGTCVEQYHVGCDATPAKRRSSRCRSSRSRKSRRSAKKKPPFDPSLSSFCLYAPEEET